MKFILATKQYMTQVFDEEGRVHPVTVLTAGPVTVTQVKKSETDGYDALQFGFMDRKEKRVNKAQRPKGNYRYFREFRPENGEAVALEEGKILTVDEAFEIGDKIVVSGVSKAKGFQGVVKRHNFAGGPRTHGQKHTERSPGSIGGGLRNRVPKNMKMAGRTGGRRVSVKNLTVVAIGKEKNQLIVEGAIPGRRGTLIEVRGV
jgi:large subunit ribosomal protein L3